ncbi:hypothetical protein ACFQ9X_08390 [Catenulispora yoronensis]
MSKSSRALRKNGAWGVAAGLGVVSGLASALVAAPAQASAAVPGAANGSLYYERDGYSATAEYHAVSETGTGDQAVALPLKPPRACRGRRTARVAIADDDGVLGIYNADGSTVTVLTPTAGSHIRFTHPKYLPDGTVAFVHEDTATLPSHLTLWRLHPDGTSGPVAVPGRPGPWSRTSTWTRTARTTSGTSRPGRRSGSSAGIPGTPRSRRSWTAPRRRRSRPGSRSPRTDRGWRYSSAIRRIRRSTRSS